MLQSGSALARPFVLTDTTRYRLITVLRMVITGQSGSQAAFSSEQGPGIAGLIVSTGMSTTTSTIARVIVGRFPPEETALPNGVCHSVVKPCMTFVDMKLPGIVNRSAGSETVFQTHLTKPLRCASRFTSCLSGGVGPTE